VSTNLAVWCTALMTLMVYSYLWKENPAYRFAEYTFVALATAHGIVMTWDSYLVPRVRDDILGGGQWIYVLFGIIGFGYYTRFLSPKWSWISRYPISMSVGYGVGYNLAILPRPWLLQVQNSFRDLYVTKKGVFNFAATRDEWVFFLCLMAVLSYFFFTVARQIPFIRVSAVAGRYLMMIAFGSAFGNTIQGRISLFLGRLQFLLGDWLGFTI